MSRNAKSRAGVLGCTGLMLLVTLAGILLRPPAPLTAVEKRLVGNWNMVLHVKYWRGDWHESWFHPIRLWKALRRQTVNMDISFVGDGGRVELAEPGEPPSSALIGLH